MHKEVLSPSQIVLLPLINNFFGTEFSVRMFREQLSYSEDIDYSERVEFMPGFEVSDEKIRKQLIEFAIS